MIKSTLFSAIVTLLCAGTVAGSPDDVLGVIGMDPVGAASCVAVYVPLAEGQALAGIDFSAGEHLVPWHGRSDAGRELGSGVYLARLTAGGFVQTHRLMLVK